MTDRWSDLSLWPAKEPEVSPLREEASGEYARCGICGELVRNAANDWERHHVRMHGAVARSTDPGTSWEAARSITPEKLRESQAYVLSLFKRLGPMNDERLVLHSGLSPSGTRTRRSELVSMGLVRDSGRKDVLRSGRKAIVWEAV